MTGCENQKYLSRLESYLIDAKLKNDSQTFLGLMTELERMKEEVCSNFSVIERLENTIRGISQSLQLSNNAIVARVLNAPITAPCNCKRSNPNYKEEANEMTFPQICTESCKFRTCPNHTEENYGNPCTHLWTEYENKNLLDKLIKDTTRSYQIPNDSITHDTPQKIYRRSLSPNGR